MMNESANFNIPALLPAGPEKMLERTKADGLTVPLAGYTVTCDRRITSGAQSAGLEHPGDIRTLYFREAGAEVVSYSAECSVERE
jgi:hypothetical protein